MSFALLGLAQKQLGLKAREAIKLPENQRKYMAAITNSTLKAEFARTAKILLDQKRNLSAEAVAMTIVRFVLAETDPEYMEDGHKEHRKALADVIKPFFTAPNNVQNSILAETLGGDGQPLMPKVKTIKVASMEEFV